MNDVRCRRVPRSLAEMSADEQSRVAGWSLRMLADVSPDEAAEDIDRSLDLVPDADHEQAREAVLNMRDDHGACHESKVVPLHQRMDSGHYPVPPHAHSGVQNENGAPRPSVVATLYAQCQTIRDQTARCRAIADQTLEALTRSRALLDAACTLSAHTQTRTIDCSNGLLRRQPVR